MTVKKPIAPASLNADLAESDATAPTDEATRLVGENGPPSGEATEKAISAWSRRQRWLAWALVLVATAGLLATVSYGREWLSDRAIADDKKAALRSARTVAEALASVNYKTAESDLAAIGTMGTDDFSVQISKNLDAQVDVIKSIQMDSTAKIAAAGIRSISSDVAKVDVAVVSSVMSKETPKGTKRSYRMGITLKQDAKGTWLVSKVVFVQ